VTFGILSLWGASCCVMYTYIFQTYTRDRNWEFIDVIFLFVHNVFRPLRAIFRWNTVTQFLEIYKQYNCVSPEDGPKGPKHVVNKEKNINKFSVVIAGLCLKDIRDFQKLSLSRSRVPKLWVLSLYCVHNINSKETTPARPQSLTNHHRCLNCWSKWYRGNAKLLFFMYIHRRLTNKQSTATGVWKYSKRQIYVNEWVQQSFVWNNVWVCFIKHVYHNMFRLKSKPSSGVIEYRTLNVSYH
jgi:hypothetical protein